MVWWFGGTDAEAEALPGDEESCELVPVLIERTSLNSRRIGGEITVDRPIDDVWAILTDYDNLSVHVPNLVESRRLGPADGSSAAGTRRRGGRGGGRRSLAAGTLAGGDAGTQGDGSYTCRLFQKGAQKIVGFQFAASVTMDMAEGVVSAVEGRQQRSISFKCVDSQFFSEFDGDWTVTEGPVPDPITGERPTTLKYVVDVRPKGPVPVAALEWRIREDVPTNLRAVKKSATDVGLEGVRILQAGAGAAGAGAGAGAAAGSSNWEAVDRALTRAAVPASAARDAAVAATGRARSLVGRAGEAVRTAAATGQRRPQQRLSPVWLEDETLASYLED